MGSIPTDTFGLSRREESMAKLAKWFEDQPRHISVLVALFAWGIPYYLNNHFSLWDPITLPLLSGEAEIPFWAWTSPIYLSVALQVSIGMWFLPKKVFGKGIIAGLLVLFIHNLIFLFYPTCLPRDIVTEDLSDFSRFCYQIILLADAPQNCFPSLHVAMATLVALVWLEVKIWKGLAFFLWAFLIVFSTLTTKQHYLVDVMGGFIIAHLTYYLVFCRWK